MHTKPFENREISALNQLLLHDIGRFYWTEYDIVAGYSYDNTESFENSENAYLHLHFLTFLDGM